MGKYLSLIHPNVIIDFERKDVHFQEHGDVIEIWTRATSSFAISDLCNGLSTLKDSLSQYRITSHSMIEHQGLYHCTVVIEPKEESE
jgi:hypothetical protein